MLAQAHHPNHLSPQELDEYLKQGWFRMGQTIFHTNFLNFKEEYFSAIWLRVNLDNIYPDKQQVKLLKRNQDFRIEFQRASITDEKEALYSKYRQGIEFQASSSLRNLLYGVAHQNIYNTHEVNIYDGSKLIASGFFDLGRNSAAGITSFYDPEYKKHSLGKFLIYSKIDYCKSLGMLYFYPGYFVPGYAAFDYKLEIHKSSLQYLQLQTNRWMPITGFSDADIPLRVMRNKLEELRFFMDRSQLQGNIMKYEYFDANLVPDLIGFELFDFPLLVNCPHKLAGAGHLVIIYDVRDNQYHLMQCRSVWTSNAPNTDGVFTSHLLKVEYDVFSSEDPLPMVNVLLVHLSSEDDSLQSAVF
ncbi:arginyl-tRNA--protein arginylyltransferase [Chryseosolibacter indicus]|uniref:Arginyl-tRNA--protein arginylyltransferase n=1 Tax=Chryseosolibacter indicus TaxID=2782351 RepID=A0ABS5VRD1_9BACT|nr:arginyl-tRNA--protein arginylyltransferase [Chryseosolibacter indicus]MBT1704008.1 arginyl-tRNA--protein arginylyltransferase [Chryseosolibacter indicus]